MPSSLTAIAGIALVAGCAIPDDDLEIESEQQFAIATPIDSSMPGFYRHAQISGDKIRVNAPTGAFLDPIPTYLVDIPEFGYQKRASTREIPFTDTFSIGQVLGGFNPPLDVNGNLYQPVMQDDLVKWNGTAIVTDFPAFIEELELYLTVGGGPYTPADVTFNPGSPWVVMKDPKTLTPEDATEIHWSAFGDCPGGGDKIYGNVLFPIRNLTLYKNSLQHLRERLRVLVGDSVKDFTWKTNSGAEQSVPCYPAPGKTLMQTALDEYRAGYDGLRAAAPNLGLKYMHGELATRYPTDPNLPNQQTIDHDNAVAFLAQQRAMQPPVPNVGLAQSSHYVQNYPPENTTRSANKIVRFFSDMEAGHPSEYLEVPQFGLLNDKAFGKAFQDFGPRAASWHFQTMFKVRSARDVQLYHWDVTFDRLHVDSRHRYLALSGVGWLYQILDHLRGTATYSLGVTSDTTTTQTEAYAVGFVETGKTTIIASTFSADRDLGASQRLTVWIPDAQWPAGATRVRTMQLTTSNVPNAWLKTEINAGHIAGVQLKTDAVAANNIATNRRLIGRVSAMVETPAMASLVTSKIATNGAFRKSFEDHIASLFAPTTYSNATRVAGGWQLDMGVFDPDHVKVFVID